MKALLFLYIFFITNHAFAQENFTYQVTYDYINANPVNRLPDTIIVPYVQGTDTTWKKILKERSFFPKKIKFKITITANNDSAIAVTSPKRRGDVWILPEKAVLKGKAWKLYNNGKVLDLTPAIVSVMATDSYKSILEYCCRKYNVMNNDEGVSFEIWITDQLPPTFLPSSRYSPFAGGVLEMYFPDLNISFVAKTIKKLSL